MDKINARCACSLAWSLALLLAQPSGYAQTLPALIDGVLASHPALRSQAAQSEAAKQAVDGAEWQFYPTPSIGFEQVDASASDPNYPSSGDKNVTTLRLQQPLWTGGRLSAGLDRAQAGVLASQAALEGTRQDLALRVVQIYADWAGALLKRQAYAKSLEAHQKLQAQIQRRIANGVSPQSDLTLLLGRQLQTEADVSAAQAQEQSALQRLAQLLGRPVQALALLPSLAAPQTLPATVQELLEQAQAHSPSVVKLQAQARIAQAEVAERQADLMPEAYLRAERQYGNFAVPNGAPVNRFFLGFSSRFGAGLSSQTQVSGAQARYTAALADIDSSRLSLGEQLQSDYAQAQAGQARLKALVASLDSSDTIARAWGRQFIAGRKSWLDVMNAVREQTQLETQIADAKASQLLLSWRLAIVGRGLDTAMALEAVPAAAAAATPQATEAVGLAEALETLNPIPLYPETPAQAIALRMAVQLDPHLLGVGLGLAPSAGPAESSPTSSPTEGPW